MKGASPALWQGHNSAGFRSFRFGDLLSLFHQIPLPSVVLCCSSVKSPVRATFGYTAEQRACLFHTDRQLPGQIIHRGPGQFLLQKVGCLGYLPGVPCGSAVLSSMYVLGPSCSFHSRGVAARCSQDILCVFFFLLQTFIYTQFMSHLPTELLLHLPGLCLGWGHRVLNYPCPRKPQI